MDITNCVVDINPAAQRLTGVKISSAIGQNIKALLPGWTEFLACIDDNADKEKMLQKLIIAENINAHIDLRIIRLKDRQGNEKGKLIILRDISAEKKLEAKREELIHNLQEALAQVKTLSGLLPICANCKKIRDDKGYWHQVETYIKSHSEADFSHSICPECGKKLYPEFYEEAASNSIDSL